MKLGSNSKLVHTQNKTVQKLILIFSINLNFMRSFFSTEQKELSVVTSNGTVYIFSIKLLQFVLKVYTINKRAFIKSFYQVGGLPFL
jgi:hypothetical protein